jgi:ABC-type transporter Mla MlaB component
VQPSRPSRPSNPVVVVVQGPIAPQKLAELCEHVRVAAATRPREPVVCDVSGLGGRDELTLEVLTRLQLTAQRVGASIRLHNAPGELVDLLDLLGLSDVLPVSVEIVGAAGSALDADRQAEEREQVRIDEEVERGDPSV